MFTNNYRLDWHRVVVSSSSVAPNLRICAIDHAMANLRSCAIYESIVCATILRLCNAQTTSKHIIHICAMPQARIVRNVLSNGKSLKKSRNLRQKYLSLSYAALNKYQAMLIGLISAMWAYTFGTFPMFAVHCPFYRAKRSGARYCQCKLSVRPSARLTVSLKRWGIVVIQVGILRK